MIGKLNLVFLLVTLGVTCGHHMLPSHMHDDSIPERAFGTNDFHKLLDEDLHISEQERDALIDMFNKIMNENEDHKVRIPVDVVGKLLGNDLIAASKEVVDGPSNLGRRGNNSTSTTSLCRTLCLEFYTFCKNVCTDLIRNGISSIEILPCLSTCATQTAVCCYSQSLNVAL